MLCLAPPHLAAGCRGSEEAAGMFATLVQSLCKRPEHARLQSLLSAARGGGGARGRGAPPAAAPLVDALLRGVLPTLAGILEAEAGSAGASADGGGSSEAPPVSGPLAGFLMLMEALDADCLKAALQAHPLVSGSSAGGAAAPVRDAVRAARALPLLPARMPGQACVTLHTKVGWMGWLCWRVCWTCCVDDCGLA